MDFYVRKTVIVTGASGLIGSHLIEQLMKIDGVYVIAMSRNEKKLKAIFGKYLLSSRLTILAHDISLPFPQIDRSVDFIFHAASPISGQSILESPVDVIEANIIGTKNCLEFLKNQQISTGIRGRLAVFSSATIYANEGERDRIVSEEETSIVDVLDAPSAPYSESKRMTEVLVKAYYKQYNVDSVIARCSYVYGYSYFAPNTAFYEFIDRACAGKNILIKNGNMAKRDNIYVDDVVEGMLYLGTYGESANSYNLSSGGEMGNFVAADEMAYIIVETINREFGSNVEIHYETAKCQSRKPGIILDNSKIKSLGWSPKTSIEQGILETIKKYKQFGIYKYVGGKC